MLEAFSFKISERERIERSGDKVGTESDGEKEHKKKRLKA
jgi:hypothetical protein